MLEGACATREELGMPCTENRTVSSSASRTCCETFGETTKPFYVKFACGNRVEGCSRLVRSVDGLVQAATFLTCLQEKPGYRILRLTCFMGSLYTQRQMSDQYLKLGYGRFFPEHLQFIARYHPIVRLYTLGLATSLKNKKQ
jgi:hypothetical protein